MRQHPLDPIILSVLNNPNVQKIATVLKEPDVMDAIALRLAANTGQSFYKVFNIHKASAGLTLTDRSVKLAQDWGVKLTNSKHSSFIDKPATIRVRGSSVLIANNSTTVPCSVLDTNLNFIGPVGKVGSGAGEYPTVSDMTLDSSTENNKYYISSPTGHIVHSYNKTTQAYVNSIGTGTAGATGTTIDTPVALGIGNESKIFVLCSGGTPAGATGTGFLAVYRKDHTLINIPLFHGKNGGTGRCVQGEITAPKDLHVQPNGAKDDLYILNGTDEIGVFDSVTYALKTVYNIPSNLSTANLGLSRIMVKDNTLYVTAANIGKVIALDLTTKQLVGVFGELKSEATTNSPNTLGYFNGLSGITCIDDRVLVAETLNNRIQSFGKTLFTETSFNVTYNMERLPNTKRLTAITKSLVGDVPAEFVIVDVATGNEYDIKTVQAIGLDHFHVRLKFSPHVFSDVTSSVDMYPIYILMEA